MEEVLFFGTMAIVGLAIWAVAAYRRSDRGAKNHQLNPPAERETRLKGPT